MGLSLLVLGLNISLNFYFRCVVSGSGKIAMHVLEKLIAYGAVPITVSGKLSISREN